MRKTFINIAKQVKAMIGITAAMVVPAIAICQDKVADNMLVYQRSYGGWPKHISNVKINYNTELFEEDIIDIRNDSLHKDCTIDNGATTKEIRYLLKAYKEHGNLKYLAGAEKGIRYLLKAQYGNGGWPQYYPDLSSYRHEITYNDNAMINVLNVLQDVAEKKNDFSAVDPSLIPAAKAAVQSGVDCILKTQIKVNGKLTAWCAQYDEVTLLPAKARAYEFPSISGSESVGIVEFLMRLPNPTPAMITSVDNAVAWFKSAAVEGFSYQDVPDASLPKGKDRVLVPMPGAVVWARFYDIKTNQPFFSGRDGKIKKDVKDIEVERRTGYAWYGTWPADLLNKKYPEWKAKH